MRNIRTDLAVEAHEARYGDALCDGVTKNFSNVCGFEVTELNISEKAAAELGKPKGTYLSAEFGRLWQDSDEAAERAARLICALISRLAPSGDGCVLVAGLGNERITPDAVGPKSVKMLTVTRHVKRLDPGLYSRLGFGECAAIIPGVLGDTGIESADIIRGAAEAVRPRCIIAIDALSSRRMARMATTVQVSAAGIAPGSGVNNRRAAISQETMGCPVISVGFPTVVDAVTLTLDMLEEAGIEEEKLDAAAELLSESGRRSLFVAPKDCDMITECLANVASKAINIFVHGVQGAL
ncbi:MAG: GPR endopeptidase [Ruminococcus sp.]|nr:GPR endopeptidase [Ruminococcus sp.]MDD6300129.1 GPR endopeptidase [Ruminococcus sp.]